MPGGPGTFDAIGREIPEYEVTRWTDGHGWHEGAPTESIMADHVGDPAFMVTVHFPAFDERASKDQGDAYYNVVGGWETWSEFEVAVVDTFTDYTVTGQES